MAADKEVIREFLVALGFDIDTSGARKFTSTLLGTSKLATQVTGAIAGITVAAEAMVQSFASHMEKLYYASRRTKASVENIQALEFGAKQIGLEAGVARSALEGMARAIRLNPGISGLLNSLGVKTTGRDRVQVLNDLVGKLSKMPHYVGAQFAEMFGMDEQTFLMMKEELPRMLEAEERRREMNRAAGIDAQAAAEASREYMNSLRELWEMVKVLGNVLEVKLLPYFREFITVAKEALRDATNLSSISLGPFAQQIQGINKDLNQFLENLKSIGSSETASGFFWVLGRAFRFTADNLLDLVSAIVAVAGGNLSGARKHLTSLIARVINPLSTDDAGGAAAGAAATSPNAVTPRAASAPPSIPSSGSLPLGLRQNNPGNLRTWGNRAVQNGFAVFSSMSEGLSAMAGNLLSYNKKGINTLRGIITKWAPPGENDTGAYIDTVAKRLGIDPDQKNNMFDPETLAKIMGAMIQVEQGRNPIGSGDLLSIAKARLGVEGGSGLQLAQTNNITINGAGDAEATGKSVEAAIGRVNADLLRNGAARVR